MNTPITDKHADGSMFFGDSTYVVDAEIARLLELDRAALMEALEQILSQGDDSWSTGVAKDALSAARANFPDA